jgi:hypothetical protein
MSATRPLQDLLDARRRALLTLDATVRAELSAAAAAWGLGRDFSVGLTVYDQLHGHIPRLGGHWTLFRAGPAADGHEIVSASVALEFADSRPVDFRVSGAREVVAGACATTALREALTECGGPLRQVTPLGLDRAHAAPVLSGLLVPYTAAPVGSLN